MLITIVQLLIGFVVFCLVSAARPMPQAVYDDPVEARLDDAKSASDLATARRVGDPSDHRASRPASSLAVVTRPFVVAAPRRSLIRPDRVPVSSASVVLVHAHSSRGPPG